MPIVGLARLALLLQEGQVCAGMDIIPEAIEDALKMPKPWALTTLTMRQEGRGYYS